MPSKNLALPDEAIDGMIREIRDVRVILDSDLAALYGVTTKRLNEQVKRNPERFPDDFMFSSMRKRSRLQGRKLRPVHRKLLILKPVERTGRKLRPVPSGIAMHVYGPTPLRNTARSWPRMFSIARVPFR